MQVVSQGSPEPFQATSVDLGGSPFLYSSMHNVFSVQGCTVNALLLNRTNHIIAGCPTTCFQYGYAATDGCYGVLCCQTAIPSSLDFYQINFTSVIDSDTQTSISTSLITSDSPPPTPTPTVLQWTDIDLATNHPSYQNSICTLVPFAKDVQGYVCSCKGDSYQGNPYLADGCQDPKLTPVGGVCKGKDKAQRRIREECKDYIQACQKLQFLNSTRYVCPPASSQEQTAIYHPW
ncbi:hypothetical protein Ancab_018650 [Ancistrocladus abbreviatus]